MDGLEDVQSASGEDAPILNARPVYAVLEDGAFSLYSN